MTSRIHFSDLQEYVLVTGASGFIGKLLVKALVEDGQHVTVLTRHPKKTAAQFDDSVTCIASLDELPATQRVDVIINLAGARILGWRWSATRKRVLRLSRIGTTQKLVNWIAQAAHKPRLLLSASAIGYYGIQAREDTALLTEADAPQAIFMSELCQEWEAAAHAASRHGVQVKCMRFGLVLGKEGALPMMMLPIRLGLGGPLGDGRQSQSWIHVDDLLRDAALRYGLHVSAITPIYSGTNSVPGFFIVHTQTAEQNSSLYRQTMTDAAVLASIAVQRHDAEARIRKAENALLQNETIMAQAIEGSGTGIWDRNIATGEIHYSSGWKAMLGYADTEITNQIEHSYSRVHPDDLAHVQATMQAHFDQKTASYAVEHRIRCKDGSYKYISSRGRVVSRDTAGKPLRMIGTTTDITAIRALSDKLQQSVDLITSLTNEVPGLVYQYRSRPDGSACFSYASEGIRDIYELAPEQVADDVTLVHKIIHPDDYAAYCASLDASAASLTPWHLEYRVILPKQGLRWRQGDAKPRRLPDGSTLWHGFITDVTERKQIEIELQGFATIDFLTQLPNRRYFMTRMEEELARIQRISGARAAVLMCDLDHFKLINDSHGHAIGDLVLKHFAVILRNALRKNDTVGRVGREEFAVVLSDAGLDEASIFAQRVRRQIAETPLVFGATSIAVTVSIGIAIMNAADANTDASLSRSDMALYRAKESGRNRIEIDVN